MSDNSITLVGLVAALLTTISFVPQLVKAWQSRSTHDISLWMFGLFCSGIILWLVYGVLIDSLPVILANSCTLLLAGGILFLRIKFEYMDRE